MQGLDFGRRPAVAAAVVSFALVLVCALTAPAWAATPFAGLSGSWSGSGQIRLDNGRSEGIRCSASYVPRAGTSLGLSLRCASQSNRIELRASLSSRGDRLSGSWEERSYNASGSVSGVAFGGTLRLSISGSLTGVMLVTTRGGVQSISVRTDAGGFQGVNISLRRRN
jgi:hypothetical protein